MFSQHFNVPKQHYRVDKHPEFPELQNYVEQAGKMKGIKHCFYWASEKTKIQYTLTIHIKAETNAVVEPEFWMHESSELGPRMLWFYRTDDLGIIYSQILQAVGAPDITKGEKEKAEAGSLTDRFGSAGQVQNRYVTPGSSTAAQQTAAPRAPLAQQLSGDLGDLPMSTVLQIAAKESATGRLLIESPDMGNAVVSFLHGKPVHATTPSQSGLEALLELFVWARGRITFTQGTKADTTSIQNTSEQILYQGAQLLENIGFLQECGLDESSAVRQAPLNLSEQEFEKRILEGPPLGLDLQKRFYRSLDGNRDLKGIAGMLGLTASQWIGITSNLLRLGLVLTPDGRNMQFQQQQQAAGQQRMPDAAAAQTGMPQQMPIGAAPVASVQATPQPMPPHIVQTQPAAPAQQMPPPAVPPNHSQPGSFGRSQDLQSISQDRQFQATSGGWGPNSSGQGNPASPGPNNTPGPNPNPQATTGGWNNQATTGGWNNQATTGGWNKQPGNNPQATSGAWNQQASSGNWNPQATSGGFGAAAASSKAPLPPSSMFGSGPPPASGGDPPSPAVEAFITTSFTVNDLDTVHIGIPSAEIPYNRNISKSVLAGLSNPETGILSFEALQFLIEREFARSYRYSNSFSLVVFCMKYRSSGKATMMASKVVSLTCNAINTIKHDVDMFGHFGEKGYGLILPNANSTQAATLVDKITTNLVRVSPELQQCRPAFFIGIASVPHDAKDVETLIGNAQKAMLEAVKRNVTRLLYSDISK